MDSLLQIKNQHPFLPPEIKEGIDHFIQWHDDLKEELENQQLNSKNEIEYLNKILPVKKEEYFGLLEEMAILYKHYEVTEKSETFKYFNSIGFTKKLKNAPYFFHSIFKPRGYAGDAKLMSIMYGRNRDLSPKINAKKKKGMY